MTFERIQHDDEDRFTLRQVGVSSRRWAGVALAACVVVDFLELVPGPRSSPALRLACDAFLLAVAVGFWTFRRSTSVARDGIVRCTWELPGMRCSSRTRLTPRAVQIERALVHDEQTMYGVRHDILYVVGEFDRKAYVARWKSESDARALGEELAEFLGVPLEDQTLQKTPMANVAFGLHKEARW